MPASIQRSTARDAVGQRGDRPPAQVALGPPDGQGAAQQLAGPGRGEHRLDRRPAAAPMTAASSSTLTSRPVPMFQVPGRPRVGRGQEGRHRVPDVDVVAGLLPVAEDGRPLAGQDARAEDRDDARLAGRDPGGGRTRWTGAARRARCRAAGCTGRRTARRSAWPPRRATPAAAARPPATGSARPCRTGRRRWSRTAPARRPPGPPPARSPCRRRWPRRPRPGRPRWPARRSARPGGTPVRAQLADDGGQRAGRGDAQLVQVPRPRAAARAGPPTGRRPPRPRPPGRAGHRSGASR